MSENHLDQVILEENADADNRDRCIRRLTELVTDAEGLNVTWKANKFKMLAGESYLEDIRRLLSLCHDCSKTKPDGPFV